MANKSRPKKTRGSHYKKYVYGSSCDKAIVNDENIEFEEDVDGFNDHVLETELANTSLNTEPYDNSQNYWALPFELIVKILNYTPNPCCTNHLVLCRAIYWHFLKSVYENPALKTQNLVGFLDVISGDNAAFIRKPDDPLVVPKNVKLQLKRKYQGIVKFLDLTNIVQAGKNSYMSKLLRRTSASLEVFVSSQSSFGPAPLISLRGCHNLKVLDLRLVSESVNLVELFKSIEVLPKLEQLCFPRSSLTCDEYDFKWPQKLWYLRLQGGISDRFAYDVRFPSSITHLQFAHCPQLTKDGLNNILLNIGINLTRLSITYPMPKIGDTGGDRAFYYCPNLLHFTVDVQYVTWELFGDEYLIELEEYKRPLKSIMIESTGYTGMCDKISPNDITVAVDEERLPKLERLGLSAMLGWDFRSEDMEDMVSELDHHGIEVFKI